MYWVWLWNLRGTELNSRQWRCWEHNRSGGGLESVWGEGYRDDEEHDEWSVGEAVVSLHHLNCVLNAVVGDEGTGVFSGEVAHDLDAVESAIVHLLINNLWIYEAGIFFGNLNNILRQNFYSKQKRKKENHWWFFERNKEFNRSFSFDQEGVQFE